MACWSKGCPAGVGVRILLDPTKLATLPWCALRRSWLSCSSCSPCTPHSYSTTWALACLTWWRSRTRPGRRRLWNFFPLASKGAAPIPWITTGCRNAWCVKARRSISVRRSQPIPRSWSWRRLCSGMHAAKLQILTPVVCSQSFLVNNVSHGRGGGSRIIRPSVNSSENYYFAWMCGCYNGWGMLKRRSHLWLLRRNYFLKWCLTKVGPGPIPSQ